MTSRLRGPSTVKEGAKITNLGKHCREEHTEDLKPYKNGAKESRYHFGMTKHDVIRKNGREHKDIVPEDPDFLYRRSKQHFGAWDIKDVVQEENSKSKKSEDRNEDNHMTNGKHKSESRDEGYVGSLPREHRARTESGDRDRSKRTGDWETGDSRNSTRVSRSMRNNGSKEEAEDDRDLSGEMDHLHVDSRSPDRRIRAMIERFKSREEGKLKSRREQSSLSPEKEEHSGRSRSGTRNDSRPDHSPDNWTNNRADRNRPEEDDREDLRRSSRHKYREPDKLEREDSRDHRSRSTEKRRESSHPEMRREDSRRVDSLRQKSEHSGRSHRRRSKEVDDDQLRSKDSQKRRSYTYDGNPEDFDIRIQRYERALPEPRKDPEFSRRSSSMDREQDLGRKDSFKEHDRQTKKNSFKTSDPHKKRESSLNRKTSFKDQESDVYKKNSFKSHQDSGGRYFTKDPDHDLSRKSSFKEQGGDIVRKTSFKEPTGSEYGRIQKNREEEVDRKNSFKEHQAGVSRITFKDCDSEPTRNNTCKDDQEAGRVSFKDRSGEIARRNSFKEKTVEFGGISYKEDDDIEERHTYRDHIDPKSFKNYQESNDPPNGRYEFGKVPFRGQEEELRGSPPREEEDIEVRRKSSFKESDASTKRKVSLRSKTREAGERKLERHARPLSPPRIEEPDRKEDSNERDAFSSKAWHESNKLFSAKYLREHSRFRTTPEGHADVDREYLEANSCQDRRSPRRATPERAKHVCEVESDLKELKGRSELSELPSERFSSNREDTRVTSTQNGATIIRIRAAADVDTAERRRRRRQEPHVETRRRRQVAEEEDESEEEEAEEEQQQLRVRSRRETFMPSRAPTAPTAAAAPTPSRRLWNYREGGVLITDVEEGQPCLNCGGTCPGFSPHTWRKNCTSCKCPREAHDVCHEEWVSVRSRLGLKGEESTSPVGFDPRARGLAWAPPGLPAHKVDEYFSMLPEISVPRLGTPGERRRDRQLAFQLPKQDLARAYCRHLNPKHASSADDFMAARNEIALDIASIQEVLERDLDCGACNTPLKYGSLAVSASKLGLLYHPACFRCNECKELLVDLAYCVHDDTLYCERHYAEQLKPRCAACDELIFSGEYTKAMNKDWHSGHFCCWQCDESLTGQRYVLRDEHPYCIKCYESVFANGCEECNKIIGIDSKDLSYKDKHWHEACFLCNRCRVSLVDKQFGSKVDKIYCGNCYDAQFASRCDGCGEIFRAGTKKMEYKTRQWHEKCFCCVVCKNPIGTKSFIPREQEIYCAGCYEDKFATRCVKCNKIITSGGVTYKNEPWHRDCFTCSNCNNSLAGQRFTSRDDKPYCADCFGELFAKRCTACSKPITGIGGTRFISFEDRHWHNDCFICAGCKTSLVGRGFITDAEDIICPECAKMKLM